MCAPEQFPLKFLEGESPHRPAPAAQASTTSTSEMIDMTPSVWVAADSTSGAAMVELLSASLKKITGAEGVNVRPLRDPGETGRDDVLVIDAGLNLSAVYGEVHTGRWGGSWLGASMRRGGHVGPIILLSPEDGRVLKGVPQGDSAGRIYLELSGEEVPWFAPMYDIFLRWPRSGGELAAAARRALGRAGTRRRLVEGAVSRAWETYMETAGAATDHQFRGFEAVLRFLRGAQCEWAIHPDDARKLIEHIRQQASESPAISPQLADALPAALQLQEERWDAYEAACARLNKTPPRFEELGDRRVFRLLLVDDDHNVLGWECLLRHILAGDGFEVAADDGRGVEEKLKDGARPFDVVLLDLGLNTVEGSGAAEKGFEGFQVLARIRRAAPHLPVILFTAAERVSLERQRQHLGLVGYVVKSEQAVRQDARGYFRRLRRLCRSGVDHEFRFMLLALFRRLQQINPALYEKVRGRMETCLAELDDPIASCHSAGLVFEKGFGHCGDSQASLAANTSALTASAAKRFGAWVNFGRFMRNAAAHPHLGAEGMTTWDAHLMAALTVFTLYEISGVRPSEVDSLTCSMLESVVIRKCGDELERAANRHPGLLSWLGLRERMSEASGYLRLAGWEVGDEEGVAYSVRELGSLAEGLMDSVSKHLPREPMIVISQEGRVLAEEVQVAAGGVVKLSLKLYPPADGSWAVLQATGAGLGLSVEHEGELTIDATSARAQRSDCEVGFVEDAGRTLSAPLTVVVADLKGWASDSSFTVIDEQRRFLWFPPLVGSSAITEFRFDQSPDGVTFEQTDPVTGSVVGVLQPGREGGEFYVQGKSGGRLTKQHYCTVLESSGTPGRGGMSSFFDSSLRLSSAFTHGRQSTTHSGAPDHHAEPVGYAYLRNAQAFDPQTQPAPRDVELRCLSMMALTRAIVWCLDVAMGRPNSYNQQGLKGGSADPVGNAAADISAVPELAELNERVLAAGRNPVYSAGLTGAAELAMAKIAVRVLLEPRVAGLRSKFSEDQRAEDTQRTLASRLRSEAIRTQAAIVNAEARRRETQDNLDGITKTVSGLYLTASERGLDVSRQVGPLEEERKSVASALAELDAEMTGLKAEEERLKVDLRKAEQELMATQKDLLRRKFLLRGGQQLMSTSAAMPELVTQVVEEVAPETFGEMEVVRQCFREWAWGPERSEIPSLLFDLYESWMSASN